MRLFRRCSTSVQRLDRRTRSSKNKKLSRPAATLVVAAVAYGVLFGFVATGRGTEDRNSSAPGGNAVAALRDYVRLVGVSSTGTPAAKFNQTDQTPADQISADRASEDQHIDSVRDGDQRGFGSPDSARAGDVEARHDATRHGEAQNAPDDAVARLRHYVRLVGAASSDAAAGTSHGEFDNHDFTVLRAFVEGMSVEGVAVETPQPADQPFKLAEADTAFDALRNLFNGPGVGAPPGAPVLPHPPIVRPDVSEPPIPSNFLGSKVCLDCHTADADAFSHTLMGRLQTQGKMQCETCHGPGSAHVQAVGCAACHGDGGVSHRPGMPSLVGLDMPYLITSMKEYVTGQRRHALMRALLSGVSNQEIGDIAYYYTRQPAERAETPLIGDPGAGKASTAVCAGCHGEQGVAITPAWPSLAGQDSQYLADAIRAYRSGSRNKSIACAACHGDGGVSRISGMPSLVGLEPQYLVTAMKAYVNGQRHHPLMRALVAGSGEAELNSMALYYAQQTPARAQTPSVGDAAAGRSASTLCAGCHSDKGGSASAAWPSLAGQDARYLADAIRAYRDGSRNKTVACAACHGDAGNSKKPGMPNLVGLDPQYLVTAMKAYLSGQRKHPLMKALLEGMSDAEINSIALYYAKQPPARAQTAATGDAAAGKAASGACAGCHGEQGVSSNASWPSLAGQEARYHADALKEYKNGSRSDETMKALAASLDEKTMNNIASYYASLRPELPSTKNAPPGVAAERDPVVVRNGLVSSLDDRAINDVASFYAGLQPEQPSRDGVSGTPSRRDPIVVRNNLLASLDGRAITNVASYYASLQPEQPRAPSTAAPRRFPALVLAAAPIGGRSLGGIVSYRNDDPSRSVSDNNAVCLHCHERGQRAYWNGSVHEQRGLACSSCHTVMRNVSARFQVKTAFEPDTCFQCHKDRRAQMFRSSHMATREGKVVCSDCHNPHGSATEALLIENSINDTCYKCHAEKRGPYLFEHAPVRESCLNCHDPHGSINQFSLKLAMPRLCFECHTMGHGETAGFNNQFAMSRSCTNCHSQIHGSNAPSGAAFQR